MCVPSTEQRGRVTPSTCCSQCSPGSYCSSLLLRTHCQLMFSVLSTRICKFFWQSLSWCLELFLPRVRTWHFYLLNFMVPVGPNFQLVKPPLSGSQTVLCISLAGSLLMLQPVQLSRSLMKTENSTGPIVGPEVYH